MNYQKIYNNIVLKRQLHSFSGYGENHHIIPKSMGGKNTKSNMVRLTAREHFIAHWLLKKIHNNKEMIFAFFAMTKMGNKTQKRYNSKSFQYARQAMALHLSETRSGEGHPMFGLKGDKSPNYGSKRSEKTKMALSASAKNRTSKNGRSRKVLRVETGTIYESITEAKKENKGNISYAARKGGTANGYHFKYVNKDGTYASVKCALLGYPSGSKSHNSTKVVNKATGKTYDTIRLAAKSIGVTAPAVSWCIKNNKPCKGVWFEKI